MDRQIVPANGGNSSSFPQQGQVDWVALGNVSVNFTISTLTRLSKAGVDPLTVVVGRLIFRNAVLSPRAQERVHEGLSKLKAFSSYGEVLWFGFGVRHIVRELANTEDGMTIVALCAALQLSYGSLYAAKVIREIARQLKGPSDMLPALQQWRALIDVCAGALTHTKFPRLVDGFARILAPDTKDEGLPQARPTTPEALAKALSSLFEISMNRTASCTLAGGIDCAWLAAVAEWLYCLPVEIRSVVTPGILYQTSSDYHRGSGLPSLTILQSDNPPNSPFTLSKAYCLPHGESLIKPQDGTLQDYGGIFQRRSKWSHLLKDVFGANKITTILTGSTGDLFAHYLELVPLWVCKQNHSGGRYGPLKENCVRQFEDHFGDPFGDKREFDFAFATKLLPELRLLKWPPKGKVNQPSVVPNLVVCSICHSPCLRSFFRHASFYSLCLMALARTVVNIVRTMRRVDFHCDLLPCHEGILDLYNDSLSGKFIEDRSYFLYSLFKIFTGRLIGAKDWSAVALSGFCGCYRVLTDPLLPISRAERFAVGPGSIVFDNTQYEGVENSATPNSDAFQSWKPMKPKDILLDFLIEETEDSRVLRGNYRVRLATQDCAHQSSLAIEVSPRSMVYTALMRLEFTLSLFCSRQEVSTRANFPEKQHATIRHRSIEHEQRLHNESSLTAQSSLVEERERPIKSCGRGERWHIIVPQDLNGVKGCGLDIQALPVAYGTMYDPDPPVIVITLAALRFYLRILEELPTFPTQDGGYEVISTDRCSDCFIKSFLLKYRSRPSTFKDALGRWIVRWYDGDAEAFSYYEFNAHDLRPICHNGRVGRQTT